MLLKWAICEAKLRYSLGRPFHEKVKARVPEKLRKRIPLSTGASHTVRFEINDEALTIHTGP
jgi:hypothetical protein